MAILHAHGSMHWDYTLRHTYAKQKSLPACYLVWLLLYWMVVKTFLSISTSFIFVVFNSSFYIFQPRHILKIPHFLIFIINYKGYFLLQKLTSLHSKFSKYLSHINRTFFQNSKILYLTLKVFCVTIMALPSCIHGLCTITRESGLINHNQL